MSLYSVKYKFVICPITGKLSKYNSASLFEISLTLLMPKFLRLLIEKA